MTYTLPDPPYTYGALESYIDEETMYLHHDKHHDTYVTGLNSAIEKYPELDEETIEELLSNVDAIPADIKTAVRNNSDGHANHSFFWEIMTPNADGKPAGEVKETISEAFGDLSSFKEKFKKVAAEQLDPGWAWLVMENEKLTITSTADQDSPLTEGKTPILDLDVWEHAYYLKYENVRPDYIAAFWNAISRDGINKCFEAAK